MLSTPHNTTRSWAIPLWCAFALLTLSTCGRETSPDSRPAKTAPTGVLRQVEEITTEGYRLKKSGQNSAALGKFRAAEKLIRQASPLDRYQLASNLDDQGSVHLRTGNPDLAKQLFEQAAALLENLDHPRATSLLDGVQWRLRIHRALEKHSITCAEPHSYNPALNHMRPYFPEKDELLRALGRLNPLVRDCFQGKAKPVTVSLVVTADGRILLADARGAASNKSPSLCAAERLLKQGQVPDFPVFGACFRPMTYPYVVGGASASAPPGKSPQQPEQ